MDLNDDDLDRVTGGSGDSSNPGPADPPPADVMAMLGESPSSIQAIARMMAELNQQQRHQALEDRSAARDLALQEQMAGASELRNAAQSMVASASSGLVMSTVTAGLAIAGSTGLGSGSAKNLTSMNTAGALPKGKLPG